MTMFSTTDFVQRLKFLREKAGQTQQTLATVLSLERSTYAYYETGKSLPSYQTLIHICDYYGVNIEWMLTGHGEIFRSK